MSRARLDQHRALWQRKTSLRLAYRVWFDMLLERVPRGALVVEVGAGPGALGDYARHARPDLRWWATDLTPVPWNDVAADAHALPFASGSVDALVGFDVVHHLAAPAAFLGEASRVLRPGGRLTTVEPWVTALSYPVFRWFHREGCTLGIDPWRPFGDAGKDAFDGDAALPRALVQGWRDRAGGLGFHAPQVRVLNGFAYLLSLGYQGPSLLPPWAAPALMRLDRWLAPAARWLGVRGLLTWERA
ncbi:MAG TPA: class I SAM-dependent methyltransferase [Vicinamibacteria bacterium]